MSQAKATTAVNITLMGIQDIEKAVKNGDATVKQAFDVIDARIKKREASGQKLIGRIVHYRNQLADALTMAGQLTPTMPMPTYAAKANASLPTDPEQLADTVFATVGAANIGAVIARLTSRVVGNSTSTV